MNILVTGGNEGIGKEIVTYFSVKYKLNSKGISRSNGYDISKEDDRNKIINESLDYDIFVNLAHDGMQSQTQLLLDTFNRWTEVEKTGYIFNIGSYATYSKSKNFQRYAIIKYMLDEASHQCSKKIESSKECLFRVTMLRPGMLDTIKSREKDHWSGNGVRGIDIANLMEYLYLSPDDLQLSDIVMESIKK